MAALNDLYCAPLVLSTLMGSDARLILVRAIAWLDPDSLIRPSPDPRYIDFDYDAEDDLTIGLYVCRTCFPDVFASVNQLQLQGAHEFLVARYLLEGINSHLVAPLTYLEDLRYGPPVEYYGIDFEAWASDDNDSEPDPRLLTILNTFGLTLDGNVSRQANQNAFDAAKLLVEALSGRPETIYDDLSNLLLWLFSMSGNTAIDWTLDSFWENAFDYPEWSSDDIDLINEINREAQEFIASSERALQALSEHAELRQVFNRNVTKALRLLDKQNNQKGRKTNACHNNRDAAGPTALARRITWPDRA